MEIQYTVLLNSRYSQPCQNFLNILVQSGIDYKTLLKFVQINIDNKEIRKQILSSNNIDIKSVPCILLIYTDGSVEKYEGNDAFKWLDEIISNNTVHNSFIPINDPPLQPQPQYQPPPQPQPQYQPPPQHHPQPQQRHIPMNDPQYEPMNELHPSQHKSESQISSQMIVPKSVNNQIDTPPSMPPPTTVHDESTPIEDINDEDENINTIDDIFPPKYASLRTGAASYEITPETFGKKDMVQKVTRGIKKNSDMPGTKRSDVMSAALAMQKSREKEDEGVPRGPVF